MSTPSDAHPIPRGLIASTGQPAEARPDLLEARSARRAARIRRRAERRAEREEWASRIPPIAFGGFPRL